MLIGGLQKTSLIDYPEKVACVVFTAGCNFRCGFCHNPELVVDLKPGNYITQEFFFGFLKKKGKMIEGVVISGGEPTTQADLLIFMEKIKEMNLFIKLDTNGSRPDVLEKIIKRRLVDYLAMDIKAPLSKYEKIVKIKVDQELLKRSIELIKGSGIVYEFRSTLIPSLHSSEEVREMALTVKGANLYCLQNFLPAAVMNDMSFVKEKSFTSQEMEAFAASCRPYVKKCLAR